MWVFQQTEHSFHVQEELLYEPSGEGPYVFAKVRKRGMSTRMAERRISESTGVGHKWIHHAGMKDTAATAVQWLSWPAEAQKAPFVPVEGLEILETSRHENRLGIGHVKRNFFQLTLQGSGDLPDVATFPNFYGRQRFGRAVSLTTAEVIAQTRKSRDSVSILQSRLFNNYLRLRLVEGQVGEAEDELWTATNGKRIFSAPMDEALRARFSACEITPTAPMFGYKAALRAAERDTLQEWGLDSAYFRRWGKIAKGARRPIFVRPGDYAAGHDPDNQTATLRFSLPSGAYATVLLLHLFGWDLASQPEAAWPDFSGAVTLDGGIG